MTCLNLFISMAMNIEELSNPQLLL